MHQLAEIAVIDSNLVRRVSNHVNDMQILEKMAGKTPSTAQSVTSTAVDVQASRKRARPGQEKGFIGLNLKPSRAELARLVRVIMVKAMLPDFLTTAF